MVVYGLGTWMPDSQNSSSSVQKRQLAIFSFSRRNFSRGGLSGVVNYIYKSRIYIQKVYRTCKDKDWKQKKRKQKKKHVHSVQVDLLRYYIRSIIQTHANKACSLSAGHPEHKGRIQGSSPYALIAHSTN